MKNNITSIHLKKGDTVKNINGTFTAHVPGYYEVNTADSDLSYFSDEDITAEYLKRFSPLGKALNEE